MRDLSSANFSIAETRIVHFCKYGFGAPLFNHLSVVDKNGPPADILEAE